MTKEASQFDVEKAPQFKWASFFSAERPFQGKIQRWEFTFRSLPTPGRFYSPFSSPSSSASPPEIVRRPLLFGMANNGHVESSSFHSSTRLWDENLSEKCVTIPPGADLFAVTAVVEK
ncbi:hypothetical protein CDAR_515641 [Caerostris darwini]|uniref:Uncharacterized protein n=1 Tax=Caerostris darwini TaxID=1538125 RepID=A0AAV4S2F4_9ARAC|nr:hypothetical protein CDAR_515641 [Caerostris darwini]